MAKLSIKKGDTVMVIAGKDKGKSGKILKVLPSKGRVYVEGVNIVAKSKKPRSAQDKGGIIKMEAAIDASNVMIVCPTCKEVVRVRKQDAASGSVVKRVRVCAKCGASLDEKKSVKKAAKKASTKKAAAEEKEALEQAPAAEAVEQAAEAKPKKTAAKPKAKAETAEPAAEASAEAAPAKKKTAAKKTATVAEAEAADKE